MIHELATNIQAKLAIQFLDTGRAGNINLGKSVANHVNPDKNHWLELKLVGGPKSPRDAVGATVYVTANGMKQRADVLSGGSYLSSNDPRPHFGLGPATTVEAIEVHWPSGKTEKFTVPTVDQIVTLTEGTGK